MRILNKRLIIVLLATALAIVLVGCGDSSSETSTAAAPPGKGGSTARFTVVGDVLYTISGAYLQTYDITDVSAPKKILMSTGGYMGFDVETLFAYNGYLFVGGQLGMDTYDITINPKSPPKISEFKHARSCDPVVVQDNLAYVTLRGGGRCASFTNQLDIIDVSDITRPKLLKSFPLTGPKGLGIDGRQLFVCDGWAGLKVFDVDVVNLVLTENWVISDLDCNDVIPNSGELVVTSRNRVSQFDYQLNLLSEIKAN